MNQDWHSGHFCCWQCDESLTGQRYVLRDEHPYCIKCYENVFANTCDECNKIIGIDSKVNGNMYIAHTHTRYRDFYFYTYHNELAFEHFVRLYRKHLVSMQKCTKKIHVSNEIFVLTILKKKKTRSNS